MQWLRQNATGLFGLVLAAVAIVSGAEAYRSGIRRDEQLRAIPRRLERDEIHLAEQHQKSAAALSDLSAITRTVAYYYAGLAAVAGALHAVSARPSLWLTGATAALAAGAAALAIESSTKADVVSGPTTAVQHDTRAG